MGAAPIVMESSFTMARLSGKLEELKDAMHVTCARRARGQGIQFRIYGI